MIYSNKKFDFGLVFTSEGIQFSSIPKGYTKEEALSIMIQTNPSLKTLIDKFDLE